MSSSTTPSFFLAPALTVQELESLRRHWGWFFALGIAMVVFGSIAISWACLTTITLAATWLFGVVLFAGGIAEIVGSFSAGRWSGTLVHLLIGVMYVVVGLMILDRPGESAILLTRVIAIFLIVGGVFRALSAVGHRYVGWGWMLLSGVVTFALGWMVYAQWPSSGLWFIGLYLGIEMILNGWTWIMLSLGLRRLTPAA
jgi:uncharacterized membrane protein HdeD (DUF308 family)